MLTVGQMRYYSAARASLMKAFETRYPVDSLIVDENVIAGCYSYQDGVRTGEVVLIDLACGNTLLSTDTSGTFNIAKCKNMIFVANASDVSLMRLKTLEVVKCHETSSMNTDICVSAAVICTTSDGRAVVYDGTLRLQSNYSISREILWCVSAREKVAYVGGDDGQVYRIDIRLGNSCTVLKKKGVVTMLNIHGDLLYVGLSDGTIEAYDVRNYKGMLSKNVGSVWRMRIGDEKICVACVHDGVKVFDMSWNLMRNICTSSMVYAAEIKEDYVIFTSFYEKKIFVDRICQKT